MPVPPRMALRLQVGTKNTEYISGSILGSILKDIELLEVSFFLSFFLASTPVRSRSPDRQSSSREGQSKSSSSEIENDIIFVSTGLAGAGGMPALKSTGWGSQSKGDASGPPSRIMFVEEVTEVFCVTLPDLWRLGQAYLKGSLFQGVALLTENQQKLARKCDSNRGKFEVGNQEKSSGLHVIVLLRIILYRVKSWT